MGGEPWRPWTTGPFPAADEPASPNVDDDQSPTPCITEHGNTTTEGSTK